MWAAKLIDAAKQAGGFPSYVALATNLNVSKEALSQWKRGSGSPMPPERVLQLCEIAGITDAGPWLIGVQADAVRITAVRTALEGVLDRVRPTVAAVGLVVCGATSLAYSISANAVARVSEPFAAMYIMRSAIRQLRRLLTGWKPSSYDGYGPAPVLA